MKEGKKRVKSEGGRGTYVRQACNHCRRRKSKCDGQEPVCGPCRDSGRAAECTWGKETAKKARTQQHFESLVNHIKGLERRVKELEAELRQSREPDLPFPEAGPSTFPNSLQNEDSTHTKIEQDESSVSPDANHSTDSSDQDSDIERLIAPTRNLVLRERDLELYGPTSAFRMAPERPSQCNCPEDICVHRTDHAPSMPISTSIDWARHLPPEARMTREEHDRLLDLFFKFFSGWCMRVIPELFIRDMHRTLSVPPTQKPPRCSHYSAMLHNAIFTLAPAFSDDPAMRRHEFREHFSRKAKSYIESGCEKPDICVVIALSVIASYHCTKGEQGLGYMYFGMSGRMSQALGLGIDCSPWVRSGLIKESDAIDRNWAYWATFTQDVCWSLYVGRDRCLTLQRDECNIPVPFVNTEIDRAPWYLESAKFPLQSSNLASIFAASCDLLRVAQRVTDFVNGLGSDFRHTNMQVVSELDIELNAWKDALSPEVDLTAASRPVALPHRLVLHLSYWWLLILLHRPFYRKKASNTGADIDHVKLSNRAAENILLIVSNWHSNYSIRFCPITIVQIIFSAGTVFVLSAIQAISGPRLGRVALSTSLSQIQQCIDYMAIIGESWECAIRVRDILLNILDSQLKPRLLLRSGEAGLKSSLLSMSSSTSSSHDDGSSSDATRSSASPTVDPILPPLPQHLNSSESPPNQFSIPTIYTDWPSISGTHPPMVLPQSNGFSSHLGTHNHHNAMNVNPYITGNPLFSTGDNVLDTDMDMNMNFTGMGMDFGMLPGESLSTQPPAPYNPFNMQNLGYPGHQGSSNGVSLGGNAGGGSGSGSGGGGSGSHAHHPEQTYQITEHELIAMMDQVMQQHHHQQQQQQQQHGGNNGNNGTGQVLMHSRS